MESVLLGTQLTLLFSTVRTVLKYRSGQLPSLGARAFHDARAGADKVSVIILFQQQGMKTWILVPN